MPRLLRHFAAAAVGGAQRLENHVALGAFHGLMQRRARSRRWRRDRVGCFSNRMCSASITGPFDQHQCPLQQVVELAHVAGPGVGEQQVRGVGATAPGCARRAAARIEQVHRQRQHIVAALAQRRESPAETRSGGSRGLRGSGRRRLRRADCGWWWRARARRATSARGRRGARLRAPAARAAAWPAARSGISVISSSSRVPPCACSNLPAMRGMRAGEGAALVAEQHRFEHVLGNRRAVDRDERLVGARLSRDG